MDFNKIKSDDMEYIANTYSRFDICIVGGKNATLVDSDGREVIDFTSGIGVNSLGISDDNWVQAISEQAARLQHISNIFYSEPAIKVAKALINATSFDKVFFANSGAEANEGAIKIARKRSFDKYGEGRSNIVTLKNSFHGRTITTLAATGQDVFHNFFHPFTQGFRYAQANCIDSLLEQIDESVCGVMIELIQGEGGVLPLEKSYVDEIVQICKERDLTLIVDEVQTGIGRTGKFLCCEHYGISPDIVTLAKGLGSGLPIGAILMADTVSSVLGAGSHATTFGGNPIASAGAFEVVKRVSDSNFLDDVAKKGDYIRERLSKLDGITSISGSGLMLGIELTDKNVAEVVADSIKAGALFLTAKSKLRLLPPLTISYEEIDKGLEVLEQVLNRKY
ncbi:MAG: aspartate aminotransferase family protein [Clostridiales bacterium]|nr:aspartate aminotransferase family protein [Clostridiales bacterium]